MLSTPLRRCVLSGIRLPSFFHEPFSIRTHPRTGAPWLVPASLEPTLRETLRSMPDFTPELPPLSPELDPPSKSILSPTSDAQDLSPTTSAQKTRISSSTAPIPTSHRLAPYPPFANSIHITSQHLALAHIKQFLKRKTQQRLIPLRWNTKGPEKGVNFKDMVWRQDMDALTLDLIRKRAIHLLRYTGLETRNCYVMPCKDYEKIKAHTQVGAVLWTGRQNMKMDETQTLVLDPSLPSPPLYAMVIYKERHIPIYNLHALLGERHFKSLIALGWPFDEPLAVVKMKRNTRPLLVWLWKLMGYIGEGSVNGGSKFTTAVEK